MKNRASLFLAVFLFLNPLTSSAAPLQPTWSGTATGTTYNTRPFFKFLATPSAGLAINDAFFELATNNIFTLGLQTFYYNANLTKFKGINEAVTGATTVTFRPSVALAAGTWYARVTVYDKTGTQPRDSPVSATLTFTVAAMPAWTDNPTVTAGSTRVKAVHLTELRTRIDTVRVFRALGAYGSYTRTPASSNFIMADDFNDTRTALDQAVNVATGSNITYSDNPTITAGASTIKDGDINEMRGSLGPPVAGVYIP